jgi:outer membrane biogenesis lipoprotein LolB
MKRLLPILVAAFFAFSGCATSEQKEARQQKKAERDADRSLAEEQRRLLRDHARYSTGELLIMHRTYTEFLYGDTGESDSRTINLSNPLATRIWGTSKENTAKKLIKLERELLRRWNAGDKEAYLPSFAEVQ